jgi:RecA-family ATPase
MDDNLSADLNRQQTAFVRELTHIAKRFNVLIFLIAHPKKVQNGKSTFTNDDVSGSSNITNLVDVVLRYDVPEKKEGDGALPPRMLQVSKNRLTGKILMDGIGLYYDEASRRISESNNPESFKWVLGWEANEDGFSDVGDMEIPF